MILDGREREAGLADDLREPVQGVGGVAPLLPVEGRPELRGRALTQSWNDASCRACDRGYAGLFRSGGQ